MHRKYTGKRCFILCTGPSLTISDLELLKNEYTFGMNSTCMVHDKINWKSDFFAVQDIFIFERLKETILNTDNGIVFLPGDYLKNFNIPKDWILFPMCGSYHIYEMRYETRYFAKFSDNCYVKVYDGYSITYSILQLAMYIGFDEIYLIGADCSYLGEKQHFIEHGNYDPSFKTATERLFASYGEAKNYAESHGVKIFNATRGGKLEMFTRVNLEDVLSKNEKNKDFSE